MSGSIGKTMNLIVWILATYALVSGSVYVAYSLSPGFIDKVINIPSYIALSISFGALAWYAKQTNILEGGFVLLVAIAIAVLEINTQASSFLISSEKFKVDSAEQKKEDSIVELQQQKLSMFKNVNIDVNAKIEEKSALESQLSGKKEAAKLQCKRSEKKCQNRILEGSGELEAKISAINTILKLNDNKVKAISSAEKSFNSVGKNDWKKNHPMFISASRFLYDTPERAEDARAIIQHLKAFLLVCIGFFSLRAASLGETIEESVIPSPRSKKTFLDKAKTTLETAKQTIAELPLKAKQMSEKDRIISQHLHPEVEHPLALKRTGTDNQPTEGQQTRGTATVLSFPQTQGHAVNLAKQGQQSQGQGQGNNEKSPAKRTDVRPFTRTEGQKPQGQTKKPSDARTVKTRTMSDTHKLKLKLFNEALRDGSYFKLYATVNCRDVGRFLGVSKDTASEFIKLANGDKK